MNKKRILFICPEYPPIGGGAGKAASEFARHLYPESENVSVLTMRREFSSSQSVELLEVFPTRSSPSFCSLFKYILFPFSSFFKMMCLAKAQRPAIIVCFFAIPTGVAPLLYKFFTGTPYIVFLRGGDVPGFMPETLGRYHALFGGVFRLVCRHASTILANGAVLQQLAQEQLSELPVVNLPNGITVSEYKDRSSQHLEVVFAARLVFEQKGVENLPRVWDDIHRRYAAFSPRLTVVGDGPAMDWLQENIGKDDVRFTGWLERDTLIEIMGESDLFLHLSNYEGVSNSLLEALAAGCVILAPEGKNPELEEAPAFYYLPGKEIADLSLEAIREVGFQNHQFALAFQWENAATTLRQILEHYL